MILVLFCCDFLQCGGGLPSCASVLVVVQGRTSSLPEARRECATALSARSFSHLLPLISVRWPCRTAGSEGPDHWERMPQPDL
uniref:Secreted protein n=1 Tax=Arundo donax TaxID=35708 RepID=A0A0A9BXA6_ARUDO